MNDKETVKRARAGDKDAFASLYMQHKDSLYRYAYFKLNSEADAQDAVSNAIVAAYSAIGTLKSEKAFTSWLFSILYRECCTVLRRRCETGIPAQLSEADTAQPCTSLMAPELREALAILQSDEKDIVLLSVIAGYNSREIAALTGLKAATVRSRLSRSLAKMRAFLE